MVGQQNADIVDTLQLSDVAIATIFVFLCMRCTLAPPGEYNWTVHGRRRCGLMSNYFDHLFLFSQVSSLPVHKMSEWIIVVITATVHWYDNLLFVEIVCLLQIRQYSKFFL